jgi:hypothetical protein
VWHDVGAEEVAGYSPSFGQSRRDHESRGR